ncbi:hypothetical protein OIU76_020466 [Salix suchowensis]|nr:hypothetical protein OIU76_020466 [Salix suchowensis]KAJ6315610.1 hypothetical protein OIU78_018977 [Salix suchowensis]
MPSAGACSARTKPGSYSTNLSFTATTTRQPRNVWCHPRQSSSSGMCTTVHHQVLGDGVQEAMPVLLSKVLRKVLVCASWHVREQTVLPLLQQLEDQERRAQVPLKIRVSTGPSPSSSYLIYQ